VASCQISTQPHRFYCGVLFSKGWELRVPFRQVEVERTEPLYLLPAHADRKRVP